MCGVQGGRLHLSFIVYRWRFRLTGSQTPADAAAVPPPLSFLRESRNRVTLAPGRSSSKLPRPSNTDPPIEASLGHYVSPWLSRAILPPPPGSVPVRRFHPDSVARWRVLQPRFQSILPRPKMKMQAARPEQACGERCSRAIECSMLPVERLRQDHSELKRPELKRLERERQKRWQAQPHRLSIGLSWEPAPQAESQ